MERNRFFRPAVDYSGGKDEADKRNEAPEGASHCPAGDAGHGLAFEGAALHGARAVHLPEPAQQRPAHVGKRRERGPEAHGFWRRQTAHGFRSMASTLLNEPDTGMT